MAHPITPDSLYITGLAHEYPPHALDPDEFERLVKRLHPEHATSAGLQKLLHLNRKTQIKSRQLVLDHSQWTTTPPPIDELARVFRTEGVDLAAAACSKAILEARLSVADITHVVAVTCTYQGNPGYDLLVCQKLKLRPNVQRVLLHGVGCAGGLSALRAAADIAAAATQRGRLARVLVIAVELCSLFLRAELHAASQDEALHIAPALFSDAAAALVVCNGLAVERHQSPIYELLEWDSAVVPGTKDYMSYDIQANGLIATITKDVPKTAVSAIQPMFDSLRTAPSKKNTWTHLQPTSFDWAIHPGGAAILKGAQQALHITDDHIRASLEVYHNNGNTSSATVLVVLDKLRGMGKGRDHIVATSFGPGLMIEMCVMKRCRGVEAVPPVHSGSGRKYKMCLPLPSRLVRMVKRMMTSRREKEGKQEIMSVAS